MTHLIDRAFVCPKCNAPGLQQGAADIDKRGGIAVCFMYCEPCEWQWDAVMGEAMVENEEPM